jgi:anion-transporting  ArsA/GET3 family ATPase
MDEIDKLLSKIDKRPVSDRSIDPTPAKPVKPPSNNPKNSKSIDDLLDGLGDVSQPVVNMPQVVSPQNDRAIESLISDVKIDLAAAERERQQAELRQQQELALEQQRQAKAKQQRLDRLQAERRQELSQEATLWLRQLKPKSDEAKWFEEFACNYNTPLEAAIEYLEALKSIDSTIPKQ